MRPAEADGGYSRRAAEMIASVLVPEASLFCRWTRSRSSAPGRLDGREQPVHPRRRVVVREGRPVPLVALVEFGGAASCIASQRHVPRRVEALVTGAVEPAPGAARCVVVQPGALVLEVQDQLELKARVGHREADVVQPRPLGRLAEARVVPWPLDVEYAPELVDLGFLIKGLAARGRGARVRRPR
jgi:hypothetical protein